MHRELLKFLWYGISIKIILIYRVKPNKIRQPKHFGGCRTLNPTPDKIKSYKLLFKKITKSSLGDKLLKLLVNPVYFIINILITSFFMI